MLLSSVSSNLTSSLSRAMISVSDFRRLLGGGGGGTFPLIMPLVPGVAICRVSFSANIDFGDCTGLGGEVGAVGSGGAACRAAGVELRGYGRVVRLIVRSLACMFRISLLQIFRCIDKKGM